MPSKTEHLTSEPTIRITNQQTSPHDTAAEETRRAALESVQAEIAREKEQTKARFRPQGSRTLSNLVSFVKDTILGHSHSDLTQELLNATPGAKSGAAQPSTIDLGAITCELPCELGNRYEKKEEFASGGQGTISMARDLVLRRTVALKSLKPEHLDNPEVRSAFINEALITAQLEHPAIVPIYSLMGDDKQGLHLTMQLLRGKTLYDVLNSDMTHLEANRPGNWEYIGQLHRRINTLIRVCEAIAYAHSKGIIHCDLKPENIMYGEYGGVYVMDWGIARRIGESRGQLDGTPRYMPPEVFETGERGVSGDIYALGMILFQIATLKEPYRGSFTREVIRKTRAGERNRIENAYGMPIPAALAAIIDKATAFRKDDRYASVSALIRDLKMMLEDEPVSALPETLMTKSVRALKRHSRAFLILFLIGWLTALGFSFHSLKKLHLDTARRLAKVQSLNSSLRNARTRSRVAQELASIDHNMLRGAFLLGNGFYASSMQLQGLAEGLGHLQNASVQQHTTTALPALPCTAIHETDSPARASAVSAAYSAPINPGVCSYDVPAGASQQDIEKQLAGTAPLTYMLRRIVLASSGYPLNSRKSEEMLTRYMLETGLPINRAYICLDSTGLCLAYPFDNDHKVGQDARRSSWYARGYQTYQSGELSSDQTREFLLSETGGILRITCSIPIVDAGRNFIGVAAFDMLLERFRNLLAHGLGNATPEYVTDRFLVTPAGAIACAVRFNASDAAKEQSGTASTEDSMAEMLALHHNILSLISEGSDVTHREFNDMGNNYFMHCAFIPGMNMFLIERTDPDKLLNYSGNDQESSASHPMLPMPMNLEESL